MQARCYIIWSVSSLTYHIYKAKKSSIRLSAFDVLHFSPHVEAISVVVQTFTYIPVAGKSVVELVRYLFTLPDMKSFLSQRICQDPLERFFGLQQQRGSANDNPNVQEFTKNTQALRVVNSVVPAPLRGNCRGSKLDTSIDKENINKPLPKINSIYSASNTDMIMTY